jgi:hypothetical protein
MPRKASKKKQEARKEAIEELVREGEDINDAIAIVDAKEDSRKARVSSTVSAGGDMLALNVPGRSLEAEDLLEREEAQTVPEDPRGLRSLPEAPEQAGSQTTMRILELLGNVGGSIADSRALGKANKANAQAQARANLINTLRGRQTAAVEPQEPKTGILGTLARGLGGGARAVREGREAEVAGDQAGFENELELAGERRLSFDAESDRVKAEKADGLGLGSVQSIAQDIGFTLAEDPSIKNVGESIRNEIMTRLGEKFVAPLEKTVLRAHSEQAAALKERMDEVHEGARGAAIDAIDKESLSPKQALQRYQRILLDADVLLTESQVEENLNFFASQTKTGFNLSAADRKRLSGIIALDSSLKRVGERLQQPQFADNFGRLRASVDEIEVAISASTVETGLIGLMTDIGFTAEVA